MDIEHRNRESGPVVLVIDDQEQNIRLVGQVLATAGYDIAPALSGREGIDLALASPPDLILLDMRMPGFDGFEVLASLREAPSLRDVPVIFLTANADRDNLMRAFSSGAVDYIVKPFVADELIARVRTHIDLKCARDHLELVAIERQRTAETISHDLRNHFGNILFAAHMLQDTKLEPDQSPRLIDSIRVSAEAGTLFLQGILEHEFTGDRGQATSSHILFSETRSFSSLNAESKSISVDFDPSSEDIAFVCDSSGATHILHNLISNALKYSPIGSTVTLSSRRHDARVRFIVGDRGPGVLKQDRSRLFQRFTRLSAQPTAGEVSTGLGLALAKQRARAMGGDLWYEDNEGGGAAFVFELPYLER